MDNVARRNGRGQINAVSFLLSMIFYAMIIMLLVSWVAIEQRNSLYASDQNAIWTSGTAIINMLVTSRGVPTNWETNTPTVQAIGLAASANRLSSRKVNAFLALDYNTSRAKLGLTYATNYYFTITNTNGTLLNSSGVDSNSSNTAFVFTRYAILGSNSVWVKMKIYR